MIRHPAGLRPPPGTKAYEADKLVLNDGAIREGKGRSAHHHILEERQVGIMKIGDKVYTLPGHRCGWIVDYGRVGGEWWIYLRGIKRTRLFREVSLVSFNRN